jgi:MerR family transcriptional regulator, copper efflux regulator
MRIGDLAKRTGVSLRMLRYYEKAGLLTPKRSASGQRLYGAVDMETVRRILLLKKGGLTLPIIRHLLDCVGTGPRVKAPCDALKQRISEQMINIDRQVAALAENRKLLASLIQ